MMLPGFCIPMVEAAIATQTETTAWVSAVVGDGGSVSAGRQTLVNELIYYLKADGVWSNLDRLWLFAAENSQSALRDIVAAAQATAVNSPTFSADDGYTGAGAGSRYIDMNYPANTAANYQQNDACVFAWNYTAGADVGGLFGLHPSIGDASIRLFPQYSDGNCYWNMNQSTGVAVSHSAVAGLYLMNRTTSTDARLYSNNSEISSDSATSTTLPSNDFTVLHGYGGAHFSARQVVCFGFGGALSSGERTAIYNRLQTYVTAVGL